METRCMSCMRIKESRPHCEHCGFDERTQNSTHQLPVGTVVGGQYILGKVLGQGGFGITYIGWDTVLNQRVAVKEYFPSGYAGRNSTSNTVTSYDSVHNHDFENNKKRFLREAESLAKLWKVPEIVKVLRHFEENGTAYIAMEYIEGDDLRKNMKKRGRPLTVQETLDILGPVMDALEHVHKAQLVHRDISPDNIMLLPDGSAKLLDFGAARYVQNADAARDRNTSTQAILKHGFAPPEQYSSHGALGPWTDVYAMCGTIYYCLTGKVPPEAMTRSVEGVAMDWSSIPGLTKRQKAALEKGMALQPDKRIASIAQLRQDLCFTKPANKDKTWLTLAVAAVLVATIGYRALPGKNDRLIFEESKAVTFGTGTFSFPTETLEMKKPTAVEPTTEMPTETNPSAEIPSVTFLFEDNDTGVTITGYEGTLPEHLVLPQRIQGKPVTRIGLKAFEKSPEIKIVTISDTVIIIGEGAFYDCKNLQEVYISSSVKDIDVAAFLGCSSLTDINIPAGITVIKEFSFSGCTKLSTIIIPYGVTEIQGQAFAGNTSLKNITIPRSVQFIGEYAFGHCAALTTLRIPDSVKKIDISAFQDCTNLSDVTIPETVSLIEQAAFYGCSKLTHITISRDCRLGPDAFPDTCTIQYYESDESDNSDAGPNFPDDTDNGYLDGTI